MKRLFKVLGIVIGIGLLVLIISLFAIHEPLPQAQTGREADVLAEKMLEALNYKTYEETRFLEWSYRNGANQYKWDKELGKVEVEWGDNHVKLDVVHLEKSLAYKNGKSLAFDEKEKLVDKALKNFNNDSFWLVAPYKVFDLGTERSIVTLPDGTEALLVTYTSGGTTPGDSYLWLLNENAFPRAFKMWVNIIPIGGLEASWDDWIVTQSGAFLPKSHALGPVNLSMGNVKAYNTK
ncbi:hypothetical protein [Flagellimonas allohymeniacidonis]|uniref:Uncharacterized protein n=1 Tax=Flagellimonas allohymeniacidonis TaxID=2517819 RepID=A0A4Q8QG91_9FLAO|nr:hypothetical protein [Allomuricauda hymeniacidonis]TAI48914.1 hypothetical protein EW142_03710 [Allomuricauda hymeniacidonis]